MSADSPVPIPNLLSQADIEQLEEIEHEHQHNSSAIRHTRSLSAATGLKTLGIHKVRLTQGHYSTEFHTHHEDEEFIYILSGRATHESESSPERSVSETLWALRSRAFRTVSLIPTAKT